MTRQDFWATALGSLRCKWVWTRPLNRGCIEHADALMGRPMGIPKTGVFGLYDMIGVDLMSDVVDTLGDILPENDVFHAVGRSNNPANALIDRMISEGFTGLKSGKGGFYREDQALDLTSGTLRPRITELPALAQKAANAQQDGLETLPMMIEGAEPHHQYCRNFLGRVLAYAAALIPMSPARRKTLMTR